jgi:general secretion pathway protein M
MTLSLPPALRRLLALMILVGGLGLIWALAVQPITDKFRAYRENAENAQALLAHYGRIGDAHARLEARLSALRRSQSSRIRVLQGASVSLAAAQLQNDVKRIIRANKGNLKSTQVIPGKKEGSFQKIAVRVRMDADVESLYKIFYGLEASHIYRFLDNVEIRARHAARRVAVGNTAEVLDVRFDVFGYMRDEKS